MQIVYIDLRHWIQEVEVKSHDIVAWEIEEACVKKWKKIDSEKAAVPFFFLDSQDLL